MFENTLKTIINESKEPKINSTKNKEEDQNPSKNKAEGLKSSENIFQEDTPKKKKNILISNSQLIENISKVPNNQIVENKSPKKRKRKDILLDNEKKSVDKSPYKLIKSNNLKKQNKIDYIEKRTENKDKKSIKLQKKRVKSKLCAEKEEELNYKKIRQNIRKQYKVLYSGCIISEDEKKILKTLGLIFIENKQKNFNVLIMPKYKRTIKFLLALTKGIAIVNNLWLKDSIKKKTLLDYNQYLIKDENSEKIYKYNLQSSLEKRKNCYEGFLKEYKIWVPLTIKPNYQDIKLLIKESDGEILSEMYKGKSKNCINIMNDNDEEVQEKIKEGYIVYSLEMLYTGIMRQKLEFSNFLFK